jgi:hypothetical protein
VSKQIRLLAIAVGVLAITCGEAQASYILRVPFLGDPPDANADVGAPPHVDGATATSTSQQSVDSWGVSDSAPISLRPLSLSSRSPYSKNLLGSVSDSTLSDAGASPSSDVGIALHTSILISGSGNGNVVVSENHQGENYQGDNNQGNNNNQGNQNTGNGGTNGTTNASPHSDSGGTWTPPYREDGTWVDDDDEDTPAIFAAVMPEPGSMILLGTGLLGLGAIVRRRRSQSL